MLDTFEASEEESSASEQESAVDVRDEVQAERQSKLQKMMEDDGKAMPRLLRHCTMIDD